VLQNLEKSSNTANISGKNEENLAIFYCFFLMAAFLTKNIHNAM